MRAGHQDNAVLMKLKSGHLLADVLRRAGFETAQAGAFPNKTGGDEKAKCAAAAAHVASRRSTRGTKIAALKRV